MLSFISWQQYLSSLLLVTAIYYLAIWMLFFKARIPLLQRSPVASPGYTRSEEESAELITTAGHVISEVLPLIRPGSNQNELLFALRQSLHKYNNWEEPGFRELVNRSIGEALLQTCSIRLSEDELCALWK